MVDSAWPVSTRAESVTSGRSGCLWYNGGIFLTTLFSYGAVSRAEALPLSYHQVTREHVNDLDADVFCSCHQFDIDIFFRWHCRFQRSMGISSNYVGMNAKIAEKKATTHTMVHHRRSAVVTCGCTKRFPLGRLVSSSWSEAKNVD